MSFLDKLEKRFGNYAIEGLIRYVSLFMLTIYILNQSGKLPYYKLLLDSEMIMKGEIWRLFTFLLIPQSSNFLFLIFELSILVMCADGLEAEWGTFKLNAYYFCGAIANILMAFFVPGVQLGSYYLYLTLFLGFATLFPDYEILIYFILPVKMKYLAGLSGLWLFYSFAVYPVYYKIAIALSVGNYLLFFAKDALNLIKRNYRQKSRQKIYAGAFTPETKAKNTCSVCQRTELTDPDLQFRYCTCNQCGKNGKAFCMDHLAEHKEQTGK